jgi:hypothetical protein
VNGEQPAERVGEVETIGPVGPQFVGQGAEDALHDSLTSLGPVGATDVRERIGEQVFQVLGDRRVCIFGVNVRDVGASCLGQCLQMAFKRRRQEVVVEPFGKL